MYEVIEKRKMLPDGTEISTYTREVISANILEVEAGTTGYMGSASTDMEIRTFVDKHGCYGFEVFLGGDCELETTIRALKFITKVLEKESKEVYD